MTIVEMAAMLAALAFALLVGYVVPVLIQLRKTVSEAEGVLAKLNEELPALTAEIRGVAGNLRAVTEEARGGIEHASVLLHAVGEVGESVQQVHDVVRGSSGTLLNNLASVVAGFKAATRVMRERYREEGGPHNGG
ncbi:MAG TPA: DUF948 domain-containing protein [Nitrospira sp.]|nr:DUF948 domain-containing protein [Nitrospira sp.]